MRSARRGDAGRSVLWMRGLSWMDLPEFEGLAGRPAEVKEGSPDCLGPFRAEGSERALAPCSGFLSEYVAG